MPFRSKRQWRWAFATDQPFAHRWAHETPGGPKKRYRQLPAKVRNRKGRHGRVKKSSGLVSHWD